MDVELLRGSETSGGGDVNPAQTRRTLRPGDRIAVVGRGIAVVEEVRNQHVRTILWNREVLHIRRNEIVWERNNIRWNPERTATENPDHGFSI